MTSAYWSALTSLVRSSLSSFTYPIIDVSGVRSSCETRPMNSSFIPSSSRSRSFCALSC